jgi:1,4-alpha-glucan branching enzyme
MPRGYLILVLHAHLPFVIGHGRWPHGAEWLYEAACETYIPLLNILERLPARGRRAGFTIGLTPILCEMLGSGIFKSELKEYIQRKIEAAEEDRRRFLETGEVEKAYLADRWAILFRKTFHDFTVTYGENLVQAFKKLQDQGQIEILASSCTHAYLPMVGSDRFISAQVRQGVESYVSYFGSNPKGIWLPECGYRPASSSPIPVSYGSHGQRRKGIEEILAENGVDYFFLDTHLLGAGKPIDEDPLEVLTALNPSVPDGAENGHGELDDLYCCPSMAALASPGEGLGTNTASSSEASPRRQKDHLAPHFAGSPYSDEVCAFFAREPATSMQVWSKDHGYPGDGHYLEFHKKDSSSGLRYWRVTDRTASLDKKEVYRPEEAGLRVEAHAAHFVSSVSSLLDRYYARTGEPGVLTTPFDAELFGHWWFEGIEWLERVVELLAERPEIQLSYPREVLRTIKPKETLLLPEGSWGQGGCHTMWYNKETAWMWESIHKAEQAMCEALDQGQPASPLSERILRQMGRELFLLQASDWQFLYTTKTAREYAESRFCGHEENFYRLQKALYQSTMDGALTTENMERLAAIEQKDHVFDAIKLSCFEERTENGLQRNA